MDYIMCYEGAVKLETYISKEVRDFIISIADMEGEIFIINAIRFKIKPVRNT